MKPTAISRILNDAHPTFFSAYCIVASFGTYSCMYAFRKPFTAAEFEDQVLWGIGYKTVLVCTQVLGYTLAKFIGIKVISEMPARRRVVGILGLIGIAEVALLLFGVVAPPYNFVFLFINGLPLGLVFGLVLSFLEGRRLTEALAAGLCCSFIISSGFVKSVGSYLIERMGVSEYWMPFLTGLVFVGPLLLFVWMLAQVPPPKTEDLEHRSERLPMDRRDRWRFFAAYSVGLILLVTTYVLLTIMRSVRDDFAVEIWRELGEAKKPAIFTQSETLVMFGVVAINGAAVFVRNNRRALQTAMLTILAGFFLVCLAVVGFQRGWLSGFAFMVLAGVGTYVPYFAFHTTLFERLIAVFRTNCNIGYLMYLADAFGYLGYVVVMVFRNFGVGEMDFLSFYVWLALGMALASLVLVTASFIYFERKIAIATRPEVQPPH